MWVEVTCAKVNQEEARKAHGECDVNKDGGIDISTRAETGEGNAKEEERIG